MSKKRFLDNERLACTPCSFSHIRQGQARPDRPCQARPGQAKPFEGKEHQTEDRDLPRVAKGALGHAKRGRRDAKGRPREAKRGQREAKGGQREAKGRPRDQGEAKGRRGEARGGQARPGRQTGQEHLFWGPKKNIDFGG